MPVILIGIAVSVFFVFTNPFYEKVSLLRAQVASYDEALSNSKAFETERDKLTAKFNAIDKDNLSKLQKLLPENVDNIRLILEIEKIAAPYGMTLKDVKYDTVSKETKTQPQGVMQGGVAGQTLSKDYGTWNFEFSTAGTYNNFLKFMVDLEKNLRIVDIASITFSSGSGNTSFGSASSEIYKFNFKIKTYWLKN